MLSRVSSTVLLFILWPHGGVYVIRNTSSQTRREEKKREERRRAEQRSLARAVTKKANRNQFENMFEHACFRCAANRNLISHAILHFVLSTPFPSISLSPSLSPSSSLFCLCCFVYDLLHTARAAKASLSVCLCVCVNVTPSLCVCMCVLPTHARVTLPLLSTAK